MYRTLINFNNRIMRGEKPAVYIVIQTDMGYRAYSKKELGKVFEIEGNFADGSVTADGSATAGAGAGVIEKSARVLSFGRFDRTIRPHKEGLLLGYTKKRQQHVAVTLNNADLHFSKILPKEPFLTKPLSFYVGFEALDFYEHLKMFEGVISEVKITPDQMVLEADER